ncbi:hypothetical protein CISIN_1g033155mg [Citrus sinensis]|uniref:Uncharacterized protein n=1 Tax=Citrus sinensis TaxID=2711 RepID=A0A067D6S8_CITSI|nr:hypothetical protein CISIN_1g033155mg [Citrus sinensis]
MCQRGCGEKKKSKEEHRLNEEEGRSSWLCLLVLFFSLFTLAKENDVCVIKGSAATKRKGRSSWVKKTKRKSSVFSLYTSQNNIVSQQIRMRKIGAKTTPFQLFRGLTRGKHHFPKLNTRCDKESNG